VTKDRSMHRYRQPWRLMGKGAYWTNFNKIWSGSDDFSKMIGNHSIKTGIYIEKNVKFDNGGSSINGIYDFGHNANNPYSTGHGYANALLGVYTSYSQQTTRVQLRDIVDVEGYVFRTTGALIASLRSMSGLRWSTWVLLRIFNEKEEAYAVFDQSLWSASKAGRLYHPASVGGKNVAIDKATAPPRIMAWWYDCARVGKRHQRHESRGWKDLRAAVSRICPAFRLRLECNRRRQDGDPRLVRGFLQPPDGHRYEAARPTAHRIHSDLPLRHL